MTRRVGLLRDQLVFVGHLDSRGDFTPDPQVKPVAYTKEATVTVELPGGKREHVPVFNHPVEPHEMVYECKGGWLLHGSLRADGSFRPTDGVRLVSFLWYIYHAPADGTRIYNLAGEMVPVAPEKK